MLTPPTAGKAWGLSLPSEAGSREAGAGWEAGSKAERQAADAQYSRPVPPKLKKCDFNRKFDLNCHAQISLSLVHSTS